ncbi:Hpt domain-containing protein [Terasakiella sp. SH-1]|uniref:Hpt domain-containing protein n=1 Tax=Terasakiella sp. SH-1 TaxID=2560057 RepID=UPI0010748518|nr:Hpt domain-containing protein [Terasakiella sp. SH-1]
MENMPDMNEILAQMNEKFLETAHEKLTRLNEILQLLTSGVDVDQDAIYEEFHREIHSLKGMGGTFQMPLVTKLCHALEDYLEGAQQLSQNQIDDSYIYVDRLTDLIESNEGSDEGRAGFWLDDLPQKDTLKPDSVKDSTAKVLIIGKNTDLIGEISPAFEESGFSLMTTVSAFKGYKMAIQRKPEIIVVSQGLDEMDGAELVRSLDGMRQMTKVKFALICPDRREALNENLQGVHLLSEKNVSIDVMNFIAVAVTA